MVRWKWMLIMVVASSFFVNNVQAKSEGTLGAISDALAIGVPASALVLSFYNDGFEEGATFGLTLAAQELFVEGAKDLMSETEIGRRPSDEEGEKSKGFISSHVSATTLGAIRLWEMYPENRWVQGFSVLSVALVGYQRIEGDHHTALQVGLGIGTAFLFNWIGDTVSDWLEAKTVDYLPYSPDGVDNKLFFTMGMTPEGSGAMGYLTYTF